MKYILLLIAGVLCVNNNIQAQGCSLVSFNTLPSSGSLPKVDTTVCRGNCVNLFASLPVLKQTTSYSVAAIPYIATLPCETVGTVPSGFTLPDDNYSGIIPMNFNFCFYGASYSNLVICDNGFVTFNTSYANTTGAVFSNKTLPNFTGSPRIPNNSICGAMMDVYIPAGGTITTQIIGAAPYRAFMVKYNNCRYFNLNCQTNSAITLNMKIVLYETTNMIDVYVGSNPPCGTGTSAQKFTQGIQGNNASEFLVTPGRNGTVWNGAGTAYRFTPNGTNNPVTYAWFKNGVTSTSLGSTATLNVCPTEDSATYSARATVTSSCPAGTVILIDSIKLRSIVSTTFTNHVFDTIRCLDSLNLDGFLNNTIKYKWDDLSVNRYRKVGASGTYSVVRFLDSINCTRDTLYFHIIKIGSPKIDSIVFSGCFNSLNSGNAIIYTSGDTMGAVFGKDTFVMNSNKTISNIGFGNIKLWVKNNNGCKESAISFKDSLVTTLTKNNVGCAGDTTGRIRLQTSGGATPYTFRLNSGVPQSIDSFKNLSAGIYSIQVTDKIGCVKTLVDTIKIISNFNVQFALDSITCNNSNDGKITMTASGGVQPYRYSVNYSAYNTPNTYTALGAGSYYVRAKDNNNCFKDTTLVLINPPALNPYYTFDSSCFGSANGTIVVTGSGGKTPYTYRINGNAYQSNNVFNGLAPAVYLVSIKDNTGCIKDSNITVGVRPKPIITLLTKKNISCFGLSDGKIKINATSGASPYIFAWSNGSNIDSIVNLVANSYSIITTDSKGCKDTSSYTLTAPDSIILNHTISPITCYGQNNGKIKIIATGGTPNYKYSLNNIIYQNIDSFQNLSGGNYTLYLKDTNNCLKSKAIALIQPPVLNTIILKDTISCFGTSTGNISVLTSGGTPGYRYSFNLGGFSSNNIFSSLSANTYNLKIKDTNNCIIDTNLTLTQYPAITASISTTNSCIKIPNGSISIIASGGKSPYSYSLNSGAFQSSNVFNNMGYGNYTVNIKDALNCIKTYSTFIDTFNSIKTNLSLKNNISCFGLANGKLKVNISGGTSPYTYSWNTGATQDSIVNLAVNNYSVIVTDSKGCKDTTVYSISMPDSITLNFANKYPLCFNDTNGSIKIVASGGTPGYNYSNNNVLYQTNDSFLNLGAGNYTFFVKDMNQCVKSKSILFTQPNKLLTTFIKDSVPCFNGNNGSITILPLGGTFPYKFSINNLPYLSSNIFTGLSSTIYNLKIKDTNNCLLDSNVFLPQYDSLMLSLSIDTITCKNYSNAKITATSSGGASPYLFSINGSSYVSSPIFNNLAAGVYVISVKDAKNCIRSKSITILNPIGMTNSLTVLSHVKCYGSNEGKAKVTLTGGTPPYTILWKNGSTIDSAISLVAETSFVKIADFKGCKDSISFTITQPDSLSATINVSHPKCFNTSDGTLKVVSTGGIPPYLYSLNSGSFQNNDSFSNLSSGTYIINIKDANNCSKNYTKILIQPTPIITQVWVDSIKCFAGNTGKITLTTSGGTPSYSYKINGNSNTNNIFTNLTAGAYILNIKDVNNCQLDTPVNVYQYQAVGATIIVDSLKCFNQNIGKITITPSGGTGSNYTFSLNSSAFQSSNIFTSLAQGTYTVKIQDAYLCLKTLSAVITQPDSLRFTSIIQNVKCFGQNTGKIKLFSQGGVLPYKYSFQGSSFSSMDSFLNLTANSYSIIIKDSNSCTFNKSVVITQPAKLTISSIVDSVKCYSTNTGSFSIPTFGGTLPYYYSLDSTTFVTTNSFSNLYSDIYKIWIKDANNCIKDTTVNVKSPDSLRASSIVDSVKCYNESNGRIALIPLGGTPSYSYSINSGPNVSNPIFSNLSFGNYSIKIIDNKSCSKTYNYTLNNPPKININLDSVKNNKCFGDALGYIKVSANGGIGALNYFWSQGSTTSSLSNLVSNTYTLTVIDSKNCNEIFTKTILQPNELKTTFIKKDLFCYQDGTGSLTVNGTGGVTPYAYLWSQGSTSQSITNLAQGKYYITLTDINQCVKNDSIIVNQPLGILYNLTATNSNCIESKNGSISITNQSGGTPPYSYSWSNGFNIPTISALTPLLKYKVTISDANQCKVYDSAFIDTLYKLRVNIVYTSPKCPNSPININMTPVSGLSPFIYNLGSFQNNTGVFTNIIENIYSIKIVDKAGCEFATVEDMRIKDPMVAELINYIPYCTSANIWSSKLNVTGGKKPYTFSWPGAFKIMNDSALHNNKGSYTVEVKDSFNCVISKNFILDPPDFLINASIVDKINLRCYNIPEGKMTVFTKGGTPPYHYLWNNGDTSKSPLSLSANKKYKVTAYDSKGCFYETEDSLTQPTPLEIKYISKNEQCINTIDGSISLSTKGGVAPFNKYLYSLDNIKFQKDNNFSSLSPKMYKIYSRDENMCVDSVQVEIKRFEPFTTLIDSIHVVKLGDQIKLSANINFKDTSIQNTLKYQWSPSEGLSCSDCAEPVFNGYVSKDFSLKITYNDYCEADFYTKVRVSSSKEDEFYIPNAFSPNGLGENENEIFKAYGNHVKLFSMTIFNKLGERIYYSDNILKGWDGVYKGQALESGIFVYNILVTFIDGRVLERKGTFNLIR